MIFDVGISSHIYEPVTSSLKTHGARGVYGTIAYLVKSRISFTTIYFLTIFRRIGCSPVINGCISRLWWQKCSMQFMSLLFHPSRKIRYTNTVSCWPAERWKFLFYKIHKSCPIWTMHLYNDRLIYPI